VIEYGLTYRSTQHRTFRVWMWMLNPT